jgi:hypothetical protein
MRPPPTTDPGALGNPRGGFTLRRTQGEVAEWLKALAC